MPESCPYREGRRACAWWYNTKRIIPSACIHPEASQALKARCVKHQLYQPMVLKD